MDATVSSDRIAVMIDADNTRPSYAEALLSEVAKYGTPTIKRVYGDWTNPHLTQWSRKLNSMGLRAMHQNAFTMGKNSTDLALVIDAMDLLYDDNVEAFALVTSDSDFTSLAHRLRESGKTVYVLGENKAPDALKYACDKFIDLEVVQSEEQSSDDEGDDDRDDDRDTGRTDAGLDDAEVARPPRINLQSALTRALNAVSDDEGWASLGALGNQLNRTHPSFDARTFGGSAARLSTLVADQPYLETSGTGNSMRVRRKGTASTKAPGKTAAKTAAKTVAKTVAKTAAKTGAKSASTEAAAPPAQAPSRKRTPAKRTAAKKAATDTVAPPEKAAPAKKAAPVKKTAEKPVVRQTQRY
ncbi:NYN domain-containing protein [uncultured Nocardioides sp.]|uniref:NYN domain-containing protein n=1 Tax=uncultured Nocardioides sp. TaxID=198441 RepID=UPI00261475D5|nr:NYN domain-containing protein [uncultured Nocardioides sp.]